MDEEALRELFGALGAIQARRMFGGRGVYCDGRIFAIAIAGELYLKADPQSVEAFRAAGSQPFAYTRSDGKITSTSYWRLPDEAVDDPDEAIRWGRLALDASARIEAGGARRARARKGSRRPTR